MFGFLNPCKASERKSYSLWDGQAIPLDHKLIRLFGDQTGIFVEAGANDGLRQSNTKLLEELYGWRGLLIGLLQFCFGDDRQIVLMLAAFLVDAVHLIVLSLKKYLGFQAILMVG